MADICDLIIKSVHSNEQIKIAFSDLSVLFKANEYILKNRPDLEVVGISHHYAFDDFDSVKTYIDIIIKDNSWVAS